MTGWQLSRDALRFLRPGLRHETLNLATIAVLLVIAGGLSAFPALLLGQIFDLALPTSDRHLFFLLLLVLIATVLSANTLQLAEQVLAVRVWQRARHRLGLRLGRHILRLEAPARERFSSGDWIVRLRDDLDRLESLMPDRVAMAVVHGLRALLYLILLWQLDRLLALASLILVGGLGLVILAAGPPLRRRNLEVQEENARRHRDWLELLKGWTAVKLAGSERSELRRLCRRLAETTRVGARRDLLARGVDSLFTSTANLGLYLLLALGALRIFDGSSSIGHVIAFFALLRLLVGSVELLMGLWPAFQHGLASFSRLAEILDLPVESSAPRRRPAPLRTRGALAAIDLRFGYQPENLVLDGVDFEIRPGESVALVGRSGVGKSTLVKLILGWQTPRSGQLLLDGRDVRSLDLDWRRRQLGWVPQDIFLWSRSIAENLTFGRRGVALADLERVAAAAQILEFIQSLPQGFATVLGEAASELSGGQRQGLAIARELLRDPPILLLDEATSQLDALSEHRLQTATANLLRGRTSLVVAHRFSTIRDCDRVLVLDRGRIVEQGRYDQLQGVGLFEELRRLQAA